MDLKRYIRDIPDFPKPGILFKDITPLLQSPEAFRRVIDSMASYFEGKHVDAVLAIEARGFLFGAALAYRLGKPLVPVRKQGKLPFETYAATYSLEYGNDTVEMHKDGVVAGHRVAIVDDLLATGGTMAAACRLVEKSGGQVEGLALVIELTELDGRKLLQGYDIFTLIEY
ncbi:MAG: adenine phosphoribosyltransferase [Chloroflexi bacterium]|nr:adenine phosphoribosyltransferase [Chloroflexota bacterium]